MKKIEKAELEQIKGGSLNISGPIINALVNVIEIIRDSGRSFGSGIRRIGEKNLCPLK